MLRPLTKLYFAYGSNLNKAAMKVRCPKAKPIRKFFISEAQLVFRGVADVEVTNDPRDIVAGGMWWVTEECEKSLDRYEGVGTGLYTKEYCPITFSGRKTTCMFYKMQVPGIMPPNHHYYETLVKGYRDFGLPEEILIDALHRSWGEKDKTPYLRRRWRMKGKQPFQRVEDPWKYL
jgi:hypothetical protein